MPLRFDLASLRQAVHWEKRYFEFPRKSVLLFATASSKALKNLKKLIKADPFRVDRSEPGAYVRRPLRGAV